MIKSFVFALLLVVGCSAKSLSKKYGIFAADPVTGNANQYLDMVLKNVRQLIYDKGMDPYEALHKNILGIDLEGDVAGIATIHRSGDATLEYLENDAIQIDTTFSVYDLSAEIKWSTHVLLLPITGSSTSQISEVDVNVRLYVDLQAVHITIQKFHVVKMGKIESELHFIPIPGIDKILSTINDAIANFFKKAVVDLFEGAIQNIVQKAVDDIGIPDINDSRK